MLPLHCILKKSFIVSCLIVLFIVLLHHIFFHCLVCFLQEKKKSAKTSLIIIARLLSSLLLRHCHSLTTTSITTTITTTATTTSCFPITMLFSTASTTTSYSSAYYSAFATPLTLVTLPSRHQSLFSSTSRFRTYSFPLCSISHSSSDGQQPTTRSLGTSTGTNDSNNNNNKNNNINNKINNKSLPKSARRSHRKRSRPRTSNTNNNSSSSHRVNNINEKWDRVQPSTIGRRPVSSSSSSIPRTSDLRPENCPALVLNADYSPLSYMPLSLWPWQEVVKAVFLDRVTVVATYDVGIRSPGMIFPLPSVISLKQYQPITSKQPAFTRFNVFLRDSFSCQYCGNRFPTQELTFDHVVPRCLGGKTNWENVVTACVGCNHAKGRKLLKDLKYMKLKNIPRKPTNMELQASAKKFPPQYLHESWRDYVYWSQSMEVEANVNTDHNGEERNTN